MVTYTEEILTLGLLIITLFMNWSVIIIKTYNKLLTLREHLGSLPVSGRVRIAHVFSFLCCIFCFVCLPPVSCVDNVASVSALSIIDLPFGFL